MNNIELLSPVGDFLGLKAAIQNGANAVYLGTESFNARYSATNFNIDDLEKAIDYAHLRNVQVHLVLNTLIKNSEFEDVIEIANKAYKYGVDAIIVQDLGLASYLIKNYPDLPIHASTQITIHNLEGALEAQKLGFKRVVLSRELSLSEIEYICKNSDIEIECFIHGALCISFSGQCLMSSMIGGRSGNRGKCAQACRLPYELIENDSSIDKGYLLSPRDLCGLEFLPNLIKSGVCSFKIEGRMKTPEYIGIVTRIYRKYIDKILKNENYIIEEQDKLDLLQVFNRGNFSDGHLNDTGNKDLIYKYKPNNIGIYIGNVNKYNDKKGHISFKTDFHLNIGDTISFENENTIYHVSELMKGNQNIKSASKGEYITIGRMKGKIKPNDKIYKMSSKILSDEVKYTYSDAELIKNKISADINITLNNPITLTLNYKNYSVNIASDIIPVKAIKSPITEDRIIAQLTKTGNTPFEFESINVNLGDNLYVSSISALNELRRTALSELEEKIISSYKRNDISSRLEKIENSNKLKNTKISLLLNNINTEYNYLELKNVDKLYIPFKFFINKNYNNVLKDITNNFNTYIYMPTIFRNNYSKLFKENINLVLESFKIKGFVISNIGNIELIKEFKDNYKVISNYTFNVFNNYNAKVLNDNDINTITISPELNKEDIMQFNNTFNTELIVYGALPVMNSRYCPLGKTNSCDSGCDKKCMTSNKYYLKDRMGFLFRIIPDNIQTVTTIYNSKITFIDTTDLNIDFFRIDTLDESISEINDIIQAVKKHSRFEGQNYTNGNFGRSV